MLSTQKFKKIYSGEIDSLDGQGSLKSTKNGFELDMFVSLDIMIFPKTYLETFNEKIFSDYSEKCATPKY